MTRIKYYPKKDPRTNSLLLYNTWPHPIGNHWGILEGVSRFIPYPKSTQETLLTRTVWTFWPRDTPVLNNCVEIKDQRLIHAVMYSFQHDNLPRKP